MKLGHAVSSISAPSLRKCPQASVTISIYNPMNWPLSLFKWIVNDDRNYLPAFEAIATTADRGLGWALVGVTRWDGITKIDSVRLLFMALGCIDMLGFFAFCHRGAAWELDAELMDCLGLSYQMVLFEFRSGLEPVQELFSPMRTEASLQSLTRNVAATWRNLLERTNRSCLSSLPRYHPSHGAFDGRRRSILELLGNIGCPTKELQAVLPTTSAHALCCLAQYLARPSVFPCACPPIDGKSCASSSVVPETIKGFVPYKTIASGDILPCRTAQDGPLDRAYITKAG